MMLLLAVHSLPLNGLYMYHITEYLRSVEFRKAFQLG